MPAVAPGPVAGAVGHVVEHVAERQVQGNQTPIEHPDRPASGAAAAARPECCRSTTFIACSSRCLQRRPPVIAKNTSSSVRSRRVTSSTSTPARTSARTSVGAGRVRRARPPSPVHDRPASSPPTAARRPSAGPAARPRTQQRGRAAQLGDRALGEQPAAGITPTRSQICSTSPSRWLESTTVWPPAAEVDGSGRACRPCRPGPGRWSARRGSSSSGSPSSAAATPRRCFMPSEYGRYRSPARSRRSTRSSAASTRAVGSRRSGRGPAGSPDRTGTGRSPGPSTSAPTRRGSAGFPGGAPSTLARARSSAGPGPAASAGWWSCPRRSGRGSRKSRPGARVRLTASTASRSP